MLFLIKGLQIKVVDLSENVLLFAINKIIKLKQTRRRSILENLKHQILLISMHFLGFKQLFFFFTDEGGGF